MVCAWEPHSRVSCRLAFCNQNNMMEDIEHTNKQSFTLKPLEELRFEVEFGKPDVSLTLTQGKVRLEFRYKSNN
jgi:hypothetical protein